MRNRRLALALQIQNPDMSAKLTPKYSEFMKLWAKRDPNLCRHVHDKLTALVKLAKEATELRNKFYATVFDSSSDNSFFFYFFSRNRKVEALVSRS